MAQIQLKMKKHLHNSLRALFLSLAVFLSLPMLAEEVEIDWINYDLNAETTQATVKAKSSGKYSGEVIIPESVVYKGTAYSVTSIGERAFYDCDGLTSVTIPNSVTSIEEYAFRSCGGLISVAIGNSVTSIGEYAFLNCSGLTSVHISDIAAWCNIEFGDNPLSYAHHLYLNGEEVKDLVIPNNVTSIGNYAFRDCSGLTSVTIGNSVTSIGDFAFFCCSGLTSVTIPNSVTSIGDRAFYQCDGLTSVTIPNSVTSIGDDAFYGCDGLTSVTIGNSVTSIESGAFFCCSGLTSVTIGNSVTSIGESAFYACSGLTSVTIPNSVTSIEYHAFCYCSGLTSVTIPNSVTSIEEYAFAYCSGLQDVYCYAENVPSTASNAFNESNYSKATLHVPAGSVDSYNETAPWSAFETIVAITTEVDGINYDFNADTKEAIVIAKSSGKYSGEVVIPESVEYGGTAYSVTSIGEMAFLACSGLTSVTIGNSVESIGDWAFCYCSDLTSVTIPNSVTIIGDYAFSGCSGLTSVTIPNSVTSIGERAFEDCSGLASATIGNSVTSIGNDVFKDCSGLTSIVVEEGNPVYDSRNNCNAIIETATNTLHFGCKTTIIPNSVTSIGDWAFYACSGLTSVTIPNSVKIIGDYAFSGCSGLTSVTIPNSVTSIRGGAFEGCSGLTSVTIPNSVTSMGNYAFNSCSGLTSVTIGNGVTSIGTSTFYGCDGLTSVTIGNGVESIGEYAFAICPELHDVYCYAENVPSTQSNAFEDSPITDATLHVPANAVKSYGASWTSFGTITSTVEVSSVGYATLFLDYDAEIPEGIEAYIAKEVVGENLKMEKVENQEGLLPAETGVIIKAEAGKYDFNLYPNANSVSVDGNLFVGSAIETEITAEDNTSYYILAAPDDNVGMYPVVLVDGAFVCKANKAYLPISSAPARIYFDFGTETGILETENGNVKAENCYDLSGRRVQKAQKGIYIVNGRKVVK